MSNKFKGFIAANKKILAIGLAVVLVSTGVILGIVLTRTPRSSILRIRNWDYFMDRSLVQEFQRQWRIESGDSRFRVDYNLFSDNEDLHRMMSRNRADFDLVVPSEYMVEKMIANDLLKPLELHRLPELTTLVPTAAGPVRAFNPDVIDPYITSAMLEVTNGVHFAVPYVYGTLGIVYDRSIEGLSDFVVANGWRSLFAQRHTSTNNWLEETHANQNSWRQSVKNIGRDTYTVALLAYFQDRLLGYIEDDEYEYYDELMHEIFSGVRNDEGMFDKETMEELRDIAHGVLMALPRDVMFEGPDQLLNDMYRFAGTSATNSSRRAVFGVEWSVSAVFAKYLNVSEGFQETSQVGFHIPDAGTNLWINSLVIPRRARNLDAAYAFINFIKTGEVAVENSFTHCGATPLLGAASDVMDMLVYGVSGFAPGATHTSTRSELEAARDAYTGGELTLQEMNEQIEGFISWQDMLRASFPRSFGTLEGGASGNFNLGGIFRYFSDGLDIEIDLMLNRVRIATRQAR